MFVGLESSVVVLVTGSKSSFSGRTQVLLGQWLSPDTLLLVPRHQLLPMPCPSPGTSVVLPRGETASAFSRKSRISRLFNAPGVGVLLASDVGFLTYVGMLCRDEDAFL